MQIPLTSHPKYTIASIETLMKLKETVVIDSVKSAKYNLTVPKYIDYPNSSSDQY